MVVKKYKVLYIPTGTYLHMFTHGEDDESCDTYWPEEEINFILEVYNKHPHNTWSTINNVVFPTLRSELEIIDD